MTRELNDKEQRDWEEALVQAEAETRAKLAKSELSPEAKAAIREINESHKWHDRFPKISPVALEEAHREWEAMEAKRLRSRTKRDVLGAVEGVRALTGKCDGAPVVIEQAVVEGLVELPAASAREETNVGGRALQVEGAGEDAAEDAASRRSVRAAALEKKMSARWIGALVLLGLSAIGAAMIIWKIGSAATPGEAASGAAQSGSAAAVGASSGRAEPQQVTAPVASSQAPAVPSAEVSAPTPQLTATTSMAAPSTPASAPAPGVSSAPALSTSAIVPTPSAKPSSDRFFP